MKDQHEPALLLHEKAVQLGPKDARLHNNLGFALSLVNRHQAAAKSYQNALAIDPNESAYVNLASHWDSWGMMTRRRRPLRRCSAEVLNNLALVKELVTSKGRWRCIKRRLQHSPDLWWRERI